MRLKIRQLITILIIVAAASILALALYRCDNKYTKPGTQPIAGLLFMEEDDIKQTPLRFLWNGWQFYPDKLLTPQDTASLDPSRLVSVIIGEHNDFSFATKTNTPHGSGTYLLTLMLPETPHTYSIELPEIFSAYRFYVNDELLLEMGNPDTDAYEAKTQNRCISFTASGTTRLLLAVSNESYIYSGLVYPPAFGDPQKVHQLQSMRLFICAITITATMLFALLSLWVSLKTYPHRQNTHIFFLLCICITALISYAVIHGFIPTGIFPIYTIELVSGYLATFLIILLHNRICAVPPLWQKLSNGIAGIFCILILLYGMFGAYVTQPVVLFFTAVIPLYKIGTAIYLLLAALFSLHQGEQPVGMLFYADIFYGVMLLWDRLLPAYEPVLGGWFQEWGSMALVAALGIILWQDVTTGYRLSLTFREEQRQMERQIRMQEEHYQQITRHVEESRRIRHDFRQHLRTIAGIADNKTALIDYINKIDSVNEAARPESYFHNLAVDSLLYHYVSSAREKGYDITVRVEGPSALPIPDEISFCTILGNLMENALEACERQQPGADSKEPQPVFASQKVSGCFIHLFIRWQNQNIRLLLENSFDGTLTPTRSGYLSRKHEGEGVGVVSIRRLTENLGGTVEFLPEGNTFQAMLILPADENN